MKIMNKYNSWEEFFASLTGAPETDYVSTSTKIVNDNGKVSGSASMDINGDKKSFELKDGAFIPVAEKTEKQIEGEKLFKELKDASVCPNMDTSTPTEIPEEVDDDAICVAEDNNGLYSLTSYVRDDDGNKIRIAEAQEIQMNTVNELGDEIPGATLRQLLRVCRDYADKCEFHETWKILNDLLTDDPDDCLD